MRKALFVLTAAVVMTVMMALPGTSSAEVNQGQMAINTSVVNTANIGEIIAATALENSADSAAAIIAGNNAQSLETTAASQLSYYTASEQATASGNPQTFQEAWPSTAAIANMNSFAYYQTNQANPSANHHNGSEVPTCKAAA